MTKRQIRDIRLGIVMAKYLSEVPLDVGMKTMLLWAGLPGDPAQDTLTDKAYRRTAVRYLQSLDE